MGRTGGKKTRNKIMLTAEKLFAEKGFDGTGIQDIATVAGINKALIYYHFKNKQDIIDSLFKKTLSEMFTQGSVQEQIHKENDAMNVEKMVTTIIVFLEKKKEILSVMMMEALKADSNRHLSLFDFASTIIEKNVHEIMHMAGGIKEKPLNRGELLMHEFFTGLVPIVFFAIFKDRWAEYFGCDKTETIAMFSKIFKESHIQHD